MIDPVRGWFEITKYDKKRAISTVELVETTLLTKSPRPIEISYDQGSEFINHEFRK